MRRRTAMGALGALGLVPRLLAGCRRPPDGLTVEGSTLVIVMLENRSYDHVLGSRSLIEGLTGDGTPPGAFNRDLEGRAIAAFRAGDLCVLDPPHSWEAARLQLGDARCDGFVVADQQTNGDAAAADPMAYLVRDQVPVTYALADGFTSCDRWFSSVLGPTWPNRLYLHTAQSHGLKANEIPEDGFTWPTIYHRLDEAGVDWAYYMSDLPVIALARNLDLTGRVRRVVYDFLDEAAAGTLPPVAVVDPAFSWNDDHPPHHPGFGQQFLSLIYGALARSPQWARSMLVITYDEHGGFYDHVPPPTAPDDRADEGFGQLGFRVPALVVGPWVRRGHVSSVVHDHTSVLAHLERAYQLDPLTARDAAAADLSDCIDAGRAEPLEPIEVPAVELDESQLDPLCAFSDLRTVDHDVLRWADRARLPRAWDLRGRARQTVHEIAEVLDGWNLGRIRRGR